MSGQSQSIEAMVPDLQPDVTDRHPLAITEPQPVFAPDPSDKYFDTLVAMDRIRKGRPLKEDE